MRILLTSALTLVLVSLAMIAAAPVNGQRDLDVGRIANASKVAAPPADAKNTGAQNTAPSINVSKTKFVLVNCDQRITGHRRVFGVVAKEIDLSQDDITKQILEQGARFAQERCPVPLGRDRGLDQATGQFRNIVVMLSRGDPSTLTDDWEKRDKADDPWQLARERMLEAAYPDAVVYASNTNAERLTWWQYGNKASSARKEAERIKLANEKEKQRQASIAQQMEADRAAARRAQSEIAARSAAFVKTNRVKHFVTIQQLTANPFVYQGQVVALYGVFEQMTSSTQGLFFLYDKRIVVSGIPTSRFTEQRSLVILAGRVLGNIEVKLPGLGPTLVPHLSFVGSAFCQQQGCSDYAISRK